MARGRPRQTPVRQTAFSEFLRGFMARHRFAPERIAELCRVKDVSTVNRWLAGKGPQLSFAVEFTLTQLVENSSAPPMQPTDPGRAEWEAMMANPTFRELWGRVGKIWKERRQNRKWTLLVAYVNLLEGGQSDDIAEPGPTRQ